VSGRLEVGDMLPLLTLPPVDRGTLALFAGASGDHNPIHIDTDAARRAGMVDVFAHGMLGMAWLGRMLAAAMPQARIRSLSVRFQGMTHLGHVVTCRGRVTELLSEDGEARARLAIETVNQYGEVKIAGEAVVANG
jgi:acyl dehydratase